MFDSMNMHTPLVVALVALFLLVVVAGFFVVARVVGQRVVDDEASEDIRRPPDDRVWSTSAGDFGLSDFARSLISSPRRDE
ncbi:MAG: hypothetical protein H0V49_07125 [Nocardioidaceae bacterium]|nr:hypothetical protein [Nocardioidaceae bacterium]